MVSSSPPSSRLRPTGDSALEHARGELRDAIGGLKNLDQLLRSLRVGPRPLATVIPDAHASCAELRAAVGELLEVLSRKLQPDTRATDALRSFVLPHIAELEAALGRAISRPMTAKNRLGLERVVSKLTRELDSARELIDLLEEATSAPGIPLDLVELLQQTFKGESSSESGPRLQPELDLPSEGAEVNVSPRVAMALFTIAAESIAATGCSVRIRMRMSSGEQCRVSIVRAAELRGNAAEYRVIEPSFACLEAAARVLGAHFECNADCSELAFIWPSGSSRSKRVGNG
jgi:hypothetical protein